ncbi:hypothetical protein C667_08128 [Thauera phenylacetica B4P]|uniref:Phage virion morphogenesis protein n=1 Tax=Thauera phenylacetica B4P TaxID=1234382 RepID=N6Z126_9RHOO|nr:phage virion morphogenesis protein [Thauera phenylacetica]ENO97555.1 hypothetical protein C667_08128 [Thauera phenylacetica B4P]
MPLTITVDTKSITDYLVQVGQRISDHAPLLDRIGQLMENRISDRFETRTDPGGRSWAPWSESTKATYPKDAHGSLLDRYGDLLDGRSHTVRGDSVLVGFDRDYAAWHEFGTKTMPRRGLLFDDPDTRELGRDDRESILELVSDYLKAATL